MWKVFGFVGQILYSLMFYAFLLKSPVPPRLKFVSYFVTNLVLSLLDTAKLCVVHFE